MKDSQTVMLFLVAIMCFIVILLALIITRKVSKLVNRVDQRSAVAFTNLDKFTTSWTR